MQLGDKVTALDLNLRTHEQISGYGLIKRRGRGGVAEVWEADSPAGYRVALKLVHLSTDLRSGELRALKITRSIRHPSLLEIFGTWQVENVLVICMELADLSLWDRFLEVSAQGLRGVPRPELLGYLGSVADAVDYLNDYKHSVAGRDGVGIQHRDLKPQNILLLGGRAKVADFGLARVMEQAVASHTGPCTLPYAAPEYFGGKTSRQSDQYALAVTYCQLRGGWMPFHGSTAQITFGHLYNDPDLGSLPPPERPIVARALAKRPEERWPDCRCFIAALQALGSEPGSPVPDLLPRMESDRDSDQAEWREPPGPSGLSFNSADSDFIPLESRDLESARWPRIGVNDERPGRVNAGRLAALMADLRPRLAHAVVRVAARAVSGMTAVVRATRTLTAGLRAGGVRLKADLRPKLARVVDQVAALSVSGRTAAVRLTRTLAARLRAGTTRLEAELRPKLARVVDQGVALRVSGMTAVVRVGRDLAARLRQGTMSPDAISGMFHRRSRCPGSARVAAATALGLVAVGSGVWTLAGRSRHESPPRIAPASRTVLREPGSRLATSAGLRQATANPGIVAVGPKESAAHSGSKAGRPRVETGSAEEVASENTEEPARGTDVSPGGLSVPPPDPTARDTMAASAGRKAHDPVVASAEPGASQPASPVEPSPSEAPELIGPVSMAVASAIPTPSGIAATLRDPKHAAAALPPSPSGAEPEGTRDDRSRPTEAGPGAPMSSRPALTLPAAVSVKAGESTTFPVSVVRGDPSKPAHLEFQGLPRGTTLADPMIPRGVEKTELVLTAADRSSPGSAEVRVVVSAGSERSEASIKVTVLAKPATLACERGRAELERGSYDRAITSFAEAIRLDPDSLDAHFRRGVALYLQGRYREALADFSFAVRVAPRLADARLFRARVHRELGEFRLALDDFNEVIRLRPDARVYVARGCLLHEIGSYDQAIADYENALRLRPDDPAAHFRRGVTRYVMGDNTGAIPDFTEVIRHDPKHADAYRYRGDAFARLGEYSRAGADHDTFVQLSHPAGKGVLK